MVDWSASMQQTFEFYEVDPNTWTDTKQLTTIKKCTISRDAETDTLGSATFEVTELVGECYIRVYLITIQNGVTEKHPLGTFLVQTPSTSFDGKIRSASMDAYTPLIELKEKYPPIGFFVKKGSDVMEEACKLTRENMRNSEKRVPNVITPSTIITSHFAASSEDNWFSFLSDFISVATAPKYYKVFYNESTSEYYRSVQSIEYPSDSEVTKTEAIIKESDELELPVWSYDINGETNYFCIMSGSIVSYRFDLDEMGRVLFAPNQRTEALVPIWTYSDDNSSILLPEATLQHDLYGIPNIVEVIWSGTDSNKKTIHREKRAINNDPASPTSTVSRGREIVHRVVNPDIHGDPTDEALQEYADMLLEALSTVEYEVSYSHGYCPVRLFDCVRLNYERAELKNIKAKVVSQTIDCQPGCKVTERAVFTKKLWR